MDNIEVIFIGDDQLKQQAPLEVLARCFPVWAERKRIFQRFPFRELSFIASDGDTCCGHLGIIPMESVNSDGTIIRLAGVASVAVLPEYRKCGIAGKLCQAASHWAEENGFDALPLYTSVMRVYEKNGWQIFPAEMSTLKAPAATSDTGNFWKPAAALTRQEKSFIIDCYENMPPLPGRIIRLADDYAANSWHRLFSKDNCRFHLTDSGYILALDGVIAETGGSVTAIPPGVSKAFLSNFDPVCKMLLNSGWLPDLPPQNRPEYWDGETIMMKILPSGKIPSTIFFPLANKF